MTLDQGEGSSAMVKQVEAGVVALRETGSGTNLASLEQDGSDRVCVNINVAKQGIVVDVDVATDMAKLEDPNQKSMLARDVLEVSEPMGRSTPEHSNDHRPPRDSRSFRVEVAQPSPRASSDGEESTGAQRHQRTSSVESDVTGAMPATEGAQKAPASDDNKLSAAAAVQQGVEPEKEEEGIRQGETTNAIASTAAANLDNAHKPTAATSVRQSTRARRQPRTKDLDYHSEQHRKSGATKKQQPTKVKSSNAEASASQSSDNTAAAAVKSESALPTPATATTPNPATLAFSPGAAADILVSMLFGTGSDNTNTAPATTKPTKRVTQAQPRKHASAAKAPKATGGAAKKAEVGAAEPTQPASNGSKGKGKRAATDAASPEVACAAGDAATATAAKKPRLSSTSNLRAGVGAAAMPSQDGLSQLVEAGLWEGAHAQGKQEAPGAAVPPATTATAPFANPPAPAEVLAAAALGVAPSSSTAAAAAAAAAKRRLLPSRGGGRQKVHRPWSLPEVEALVEGVAHYGRGQWADIKSLEQGGVSQTLSTRSAVDLKDKWRNLLRIAMLPVLYKRREAAEIPPTLLARVRELAAQKGSPRAGGRREGAAMDGAAPKGARRSKHHSPWTLAESQALVDGVAECGGCRWTVIKKLGLAAIERRTAMDLKDKWRNLLQLANLPSQSRRKQETPPELLQRVLELEARFGVARRKGRKAGLASGSPDGGAAMEETAVGDGDVDVDKVEASVGDGDYMMEEGEGDEDLAAHEELGIWPLPAVAAAPAAEEGVAQSS